MVLIGQKKTVIWAANLVNILVKRISLRCD